MQATRVNLLKRLLVGVAALLWCLPILWVFLCSFKKNLLGGIPSSITTDWTLSNFLQLGRFEFATALRNSLAVAVFSSLIGTIAGLILSLGLICRTRPLLKPLLTIISGRTVPQALFLLPQYLIARQIGLTESRFVLSLVHAFGALAIAVILLCPFVLQLHTQFSSQARLDGVSDRIYFSKVIIPQLHGPLAFSFTVAVMLSWTDYLFASIFTVGEETRTVPVLIGNFITSYGTAWGPMYASLSLSFITTVCLTVMALVTGSLWLRKQGRS
jgi:multiple sugar transport system permease protein